MTISKPGLLITSATLVNQLAMFTLFYTALQFVLSVTELNTW